MPVERIIQDIAIARLFLAGTAPAGVPVKFKCYGRASWQGLDVSNVAAGPDGTLPLGMLEQRAVHDSIACPDLKLNRLS